MRNYLGIFFIIFLLSFIDKNLVAREKEGRLILGGGIYNFMENGEKRCTLTHTDSTCFREETVSETSIAYQLEYQSDKRFLKIFKPKIGFLGTSKNATYGYTGVSVDFYFGNCKCLVLTPSFAAGWYVDGDEIKMYNRLEFMSGGDLSYRFRNNVRVGVGLYHISNAGLGKENPGTESILFKYQIPF